MVEFHCQHPDGRPIIILCKILTWSRLLRAELSVENSSFVPLQGHVRCFFCQLDQPTRMCFGYALIQYEVFRFEKCRFARLSELLDVPQHFAFFFLNLIPPSPYVVLQLPLDTCTVYRSSFVRTNRCMIWKAIWSR